MIVFSIVLAYFFFLVAGQAIQLAYDLTDVASVQYMEHYITRTGFESSLIYLFVVELIFFILVLFSPFQNRLKYRSSDAYNLSTQKWLILCTIIIFVAFLLVFIVVGWSTYLTSSRPGVVTGSTIFLVLLSLGIYPLLSQVVGGKRLNKRNFLLAIFSIAIIITFSRINVIVYVMTFFVAWFYSSNIYRNRATPREVINIAIGALVLCLLFFGVGSIRDALNYIEGDFSQVVKFISDNSDTGLLTIRHDYVVSVEGMSGLAGAFTYMNQVGKEGYPTDFGLSLLIRGLFQWIPGDLKFVFSPVVDFFWDGYWYTNSIVPSGIENSFIGFGYLGAFVFPLLLYYFSTIFSKIYIRSDKIKHKMIALIFIGMLVFFVRGSWAVWIGFSISYLILFLILDFSIRKKPKKYYSIISSKE